MRDLTFCKQACNCRIFGESMKKTLKAVGGALLALMVWSALVGGCTKNADSTSTAASSPAATPASKPAVVESPKPAAAPASTPAAASSAQLEDRDDEKDLGMTADEYAKRFNRIMVELDEPFRINPKIKPGSTMDTFKAQLNKRLYVIGSVSKSTGKLTGITLLSNGADTLAGAADVMMAAIGALTAAVPNGTVKTVGPVVGKLMHDFDDTDSNSISDVVNDVKLWHNRSDQLGLWFGAEPA